MRRWKWEMSILVFCAFPLIPPFIPENWQVHSTIQWLEKFMGKGENQKNMGHVVHKGATCSVQLELTQPSTGRREGLHKTMHFKLPASLD
jgi:hypothetical protein